MSERLGRVAAWAVTRPAQVVALAVLVAVIATVVAALRLSADADTDTLVDNGSEAFATTERFKERFGDDAIAILVEGELRELVAGENVNRLLAIETCLSGRVPEGQLAASPACAELAAIDPVQVVYGPATFLDQSASQANAFLSTQSQEALAQAQAAGARAAERAAEQGLPAQERTRAAREAGARVLERFQSQLLSIALAYGQLAPPSIDDPRFVRAVVFEDGNASGEPKARFSYLFPSSSSALISVRLRSDLDEAERRRAVELVEEIVADDEFRLQGGSYVVSGVPTVVEGLAQELRSDIFPLLGIALIVMAAVLMLVFPPPLRLLPLGVALAAAGLTFGLLGALGGSLTLGALAVVPVLIGLAVDYAIQLQARFREVAASGATPVRAAVTAATRGGPVIGTAALATGAGFLVLLLSPIPMVRSFGVLLVAGIALALAVALTAGLAALSLVAPDAAGGKRRRARLAGSPAAERLGELGGRVGGGLGAAGSWVRALGKRALAVAISAPGAVLAVALVLALGGWAAGTRTEVVSDIRELAPADLPALRAVDDLQEATGVSGEVDVLLSGADLTDPEVIAWMGDFKRRVLESHGYAGPSPSCRAEGAELCPAIALPDLFGERPPRTRAEVEGLLRAVPPYFSQAVLAGDGEGGEQLANMAFGIRVQPLDDQKRLIDEIRAEIDPPGGPGPPAGVEAAVVGLPVLAADANEQLASSRYWLTLLGLVAVAVVLLVAYRSAGRALVPLIPIALATGWSALVLAAIGIPLNPMSATLGALVIAIATEFSVILSARYHEERGAGLTVGEALRRTYSRTGAAVLASGTTAIAGFAVLVASGITMLRDFGLVAVVDLGVSLLGVMLVLPAALIWAEGGFRPFGALAGRGAAAVTPPGSPGVGGRPGDRG